MATTRVTLRFNTQSLPLPPQPGLRHGVPQLQKKAAADEVPHVVTGALYAPYSAEAMADSSFWSAVDFPCRAATRFSTSDILFTDCRCV